MYISLSLKEHAFTTNTPGAIAMYRALLDLRDSIEAVHTEHGDTCPCGICHAGDDFAGVAKIWLNFVSGEIYFDDRRVKRLRVREGR